MAKKLSPDMEQYEYGGAPKKEEAADVVIDQTVGDGVYVKRGGNRIKVSVGVGEKPFCLEDGDVVATGPGSYVMGIADMPLSADDTQRVTLYADSEVSVSVRKQAGKDGKSAKLTGVLLRKGMVTFNGSCKFETEPAYPIKFNHAGNAMTFTAELRQDGLVFARKALVEIEHKAAKVKSSLISQETVVTMDGLYDMQKAEPRYAALGEVYNLFALCRAGVASRKAHDSGVLEPMKKGGFEKDMEAAKEAQMNAQMNEYRRVLKEEKYLPKKMADEYRQMIADYEKAKAQPGPKAGQTEAGLDAEYAELAARYERQMQKSIVDGEAAARKLASFSLPPPEPLKKESRVAEDKSERRSMGMDGWLRSNMDATKKMNELEKEYRGGKISVNTYVLKKQELQGQMTAQLMKGFEVGRDAGKEGKPLLNAVLSKATVNSAVEYKGLTFEIRTAEKGPEFQMVRSAPGRLFVVIGINVKNSGSRNTAYTSPDEEIHLIADNGEIIALTNYKYETALDPGKSSEGYLWFKVPEESKSFTLEFGKKSDKKVDLRIVL